MTEKPENIAKHPMDIMAAGAELAIAVVDDQGREIYSANNNSICRILNPGGEFSRACAEFCGKAFENTVKAGRVTAFECHAGLECRASIIAGAKPLVAITGRIFIKGSNYRKARARAISGDWQQFSPSDLFENVRLTNSIAALEKAAQAVKHLTVSPEVQTEDAEAVAQNVESDQLDEMVERFNRKSAKTPSIVHPDAEAKRPTIAAPPRKERRIAEAGAWRSFFGSLLQSDYAKASDSILGFIARQYGFTSLIWLEKKANRFTNTTGFGEMKKRRLRLGIAPGDPRLIEAMQNYVPLELGERSKQQPGSRKMSLFPIGVGGEVSAAIAVLDPIEDESVKRQIARIGHSIAPQLEILRLRGEVSRGVSKSAAVRKFSESLKQIDTDDLWLNLTQNAAEMLKAERASLLIFDDKADALAIKAIIGAKGKPAAGEEIGARVAKHVLAAGEPFAVADVSKTGLTPEPSRRYKTASFLSCPVSISGRAIGVISFTDRACDLPFDKASLDLFQAIAPQLAVAIDRATLKERAGKFEQLSVTDTLTGLLNRRYMEARLLEEIKRSVRHSFPMSFMMLDVDSFKSYNDQYGHPAGDEALKFVGNVIRETLRGADVAARFGGEEFAILLPQTTPEEAAAIAERIRGNIEQTKFPKRRVTTSIGIASCSAELCMSADLVSAADKALYEAKRRGRNRVIAFEELGTITNSA